MASQLEYLSSILRGGVVGGGGGGVGPQGPTGPPGPQGPPGSGGGSSITPEQFGAAGNGSADDEAAVRAAFNAANALRRAGLGGYTWHPGATVRLDGRYHMPNLASPILVQCNVAGDNGKLTAPPGYAGIVLRVGDPTSGQIMQGMDSVLPDVTRVGATVPFVAGGVGVQVINVNSSRIKFNVVSYHDTGVWFTGYGQGTTYNDFFLGWHASSKVELKLASMTGGWVNANNFHGGSVTASASVHGGTRLTGHHHLVMDDNGNGSGYQLNQNNFYGVSFEGDVPEAYFKLSGTSDNNWIGCRFETGRATESVTVSGDTLTRASHGLTVGDMLVTSATTAVAGGMEWDQSYYVVNVPSSSTFKISPAKGGTATTFTSSGTGVYYTRPLRIVVDDSKTNYSNVIDKPYITPWFIDWVHSGGVSIGANVLNTSANVTLDVANSDGPMISVRNRLAQSIRPLVAAYAPTVNPQEDRLNWATALSDRGLLFANNRAVEMHLFNNGGQLQTRRPSEGLNYEVMTGLRNQVSPDTITGLSCAANTTTSTTVTLTGAQVGDFVIVQPITALPAGLEISSSTRVSATNTVTVVFRNLTGSTIVFTGDVHPILFRQYY